jgi:type IV pilus assembly protein PilM
VWPGGSSTLLTVPITALDTFLPSAQVISGVHLREGAGMARRTAIGLDIGTSVVRAAELSFGRGGTTLEHFGQVVLPEGAVRDGEVVDGEAVTRCIKHLWSAAGFSHKRVVLGMANKLVIVRQLDLPWMERSELRSSLAFHLADFPLPFPVEESELDFFPLEELTDDQGARQLRGLLVAAQHDTVLAHVTCVQDAGLKAESVDLTSFAVLRSMGRQTELDVATEALIDVGARVTNVVVHSAGLPRFVRIQLIGGQDITDAVSERLGVPLERAEGMKQHYGRTSSGDELTDVSDTVATRIQDFVEEIRNSLDYYAGSNPGAHVERIVLSGGGSRLEGLADRLCEGTGLPVMVGDPLRPLLIGRTGLDDEQLEFIKPLAAVPVGLALGAI